MEKKRVGNNTIVDKKKKASEKASNNTPQINNTYIQPNDSGSMEEMDNCGDEYDG